MLTQQEIDSYANRLKENREKLMEEMKKDASPADFGDSSSDLESEEADEAEDMSNKIAAASMLRERIVRIEEALARIEKGEYGKCHKCGADISKEVLDLVPESYLCEKCK